MLCRSSVAVFILVMGTMFSLLYLTIISPQAIAILSVPRLTQYEAIGIADSDLKHILPSYKGIVGTIDIDYTRYVPIEEFHRDNLKVPLVFVHPNGSMIFISEKGYENRGMCDSTFYAYCGYLPHFSFDYGSRLVYGVELQVDSAGQPIQMYMVDAMIGKIVDSTFLRDQWIHAHSSR